MLISGSASTLTVKGMSQFSLSPGVGLEPIQFDHAYIQSLFLFIGETFSILIWLVTKFVQKHKGTKLPGLKEGKVFYKIFPHSFLFLLPTVCDVAATTLLNISLFYTLTSVYQILRNINVIFVAMLSACIWKDYRKQFDFPQLIGLFILFIGATIIVLATILFTDTNNDSINNTLGIILLIIGNLFIALTFIIEEISLRKIQTSGLVAVGTEGVWGMLIYSVLLPVFNSFQDPFSKDQKHFEDCAAWQYQVSRSYPEVLLHIGYAVSVLGSNCSGIEITNHVSAAARTTFATCKTIIVWVVSFAVGWEKWSTGSTLTRFAGFVLVTVGVLIYNNIFLLIPFLKRENVKVYGKWMGKGKVVEDEQEVLVEGDVYGSGSLQEVT